MKDLALKVVNTLRSIKNGKTSPAASSERMVTVICIESLDELTVWRREQKLITQPYWTAGLLEEVENSIAENYNLSEGIALKVVVAEELVADGGNDEEEEERRVYFLERKACKRTTVVGRAGLCAVECEGATAASAEAATPI